jgi:hypothetical protein
MAMTMKNSAFCRNLLMSHGIYWLCVLDYETAGSSETSVHIQQDYTGSQLLHRELQISHANSSVAENSFPCMSTSTSV